jgi:integrase
MARADAVCEGNGFCVSVAEGWRQGASVRLPATKMDHLRPAAITTGVQIEKGQRFGLHNLRHSLSNWLVNKAKVEPKTVQGILRHSRIQTTLDLYTQQDSDETRAAQGAFLTAIGLSNAVQ